MARTVKTATEKATSEKSATAKPKSVKSESAKTTSKKATASKASASAKSEKKTDKLRVGIIGTGGIANAHMNAYKNFDDVEVVALADIVPGKAEAFAKKFELDNATTFETHEELCKMDLDAVSICTYNATHAVCAIDALNAGFDVLLEKPMSVTLPEAVEISAAVKKSNRILTVGFQPRYDENMKLVKEIVQSGTLGKVYYVQMGGGRRRGDPGGTFINKETAGMGCLGDIGCYSIDMAMNSLGYPKPLTVSAYSSNYFGKNPKYNPTAYENYSVDDFACALIRLEGGIILEFKISWSMHMDTMGDTLFLGTDAGLKVKSPNLGSGPWAGAWDGGCGQLFIYNDILGQHTETAIPLRRTNGSIFEKKVRDFVDSVKERRPAPIPVEQIIRNQAIIDGIMRSAELEKEVEIILPEI